MENKTTNISGQVPEQERKFAELQERVDASALPPRKC